MTDKQAAKLPVAQQGEYGFLDQAFLECGVDGVVRVKDGRSIEQYINDPRLVARRKQDTGGKPWDMVIWSKARYDASCLPHCA